MKDIRHENKISGTRSKFGELVRVTLLQIRNWSRRSASRRRRYFQQIAVDVDRDDVARDLGDMKRKPAIARAEIDRFHAGLEPDLMQARRPDRAIGPPTIRRRASRWLRRSPADRYPFRLSARLSSSFRFARQERISIDLETPRVLFAACTLEGVNRRPNPDINEPAVFQHFLPGCARQTTGNSSGPKINVADRRLQAPACHSRYPQTEAVRPGGGHGRFPKMPSSCRRKG